MCGYVQYIADISTCSQDPSRAPVQVERRHDVEATCLKTEPNTSFSSASEAAQEDATTGVEVAGRPHRGTDGGLAIQVLMDAIKLRRRLLVERQVFPLGVHQADGAHRVLLAGLSHVHVRHAVKRRHDLNIGDSDEMIYVLFEI